MTHKLAIQFIDNLNRRITPNGKKKKPIKRVKNHQNLASVDKYMYSLYQSGRSVFHMDQRAQTNGTTSMRECLFLPSNKTILQPPVIVIRSIIPTNKTVPLTTEESAIDIKHM